MSRLSSALTVACFALLLCGVSATGFSAALTLSGGQSSLANGPNNITPLGSSWSTGNLGGFTDGQFQADGGYIIPVGGVYHFDASLEIDVSTVAAPNVDVDLRIVKCAGGCNALCGTGANVAATVVTSSALYLANGFTGAFPPTYSLSASFTGSFNTGDLIALCVDSSATSGAVKLICPSTGPLCVFSGFSI